MRHIAPILATALAVALAAQAPGQTDRRWDGSASSTLRLTGSGDIDGSDGTLWIDGTTSNLMLAVIPEALAALLGGFGLLALPCRRTL